MLVIFSDIHLTDESTSVNVHPKAFSEVLFPEIKLNAGSKNPTEINLILLGDIFDLVRTDYWLDKNLCDENDRPWNGDLDPATGMNSAVIVEEHYNKVCKRIFDTESGKAFIKMLNDVKGLTDKPVKVTYVVGNHDRAFNNFTSLQDIFKDALGIERDKILFLNEFSDEKYTVLCRHGQEYDEDNYGYELYKSMNNEKIISQFDPKIYKVQSIGEAVTCELMSGIIKRLKDKYTNDDPFVTKMKDVNNVRPMTSAILWMYWMSSGLETGGKGKESQKNKGYQKSLLKAFRDSLHALLGTKLKDEWDNIKTDFLVTGDLTDKLSKLEYLIKNEDFGNLQSFVNVFETISNIWHKIKPGKDDLEEGAKKEFSFKINDDKQYLFMGHTHEALQSYYAARQNNFIKMYINTGTYLPFIQQAQNGKDFAAAHLMTMAFVYNTEEDYDEKEGVKIYNNFPTLDLWNGIKKKEYK